MAESGEGSPIQPVESGKIPQPQEKPLSPENTKGGLKKRLMNTVRGVTLATTLLTPLGAPPPVSGAEDTSTRPAPTETLPTAEERNPVEELKQFIEAKGDEKLTFDEARDLVPTISRLFASYGKRLTPEELTNSFFILDASKLPDKSSYTDLFSTPAFQQLLENYPHIKPGVNVSEDFALSLLQETKSYGPYAFAEGGNILIYLNQTNRNLPPKNSPGGRYRSLEFTSMDQVECTDSRPSVDLIATALHEQGHQNAQLEQDFPAPKLVEASQSILPENKLHLKIKKIIKEGFAMEIEFESEEDYDIFSPESNDFFKYGYLGELEEHTVEYIANRILLDNSLSASATSKFGPKQMDNYTKILERSGISLEELINMHKNADIEGFLIKIAEGADDVYFYTDEEKIKFSMQLFKEMLLPKKENRPWERRFKSYFPQIDIEFYEDVPMPNLITERGRELHVVIGCGVPDIRREKAKRSASKQKSPNTKSGHHKE